MSGAVFLDGDRIALRTVEEEDLDFLRETINDPSVRRFLGMRDPINGAQEREWYEERASSDENVNLLVCREGGTATTGGSERAGGRAEPMGSIGLHAHDPTGVTAEIGIFLAEEFWGEGYGTEASRLLTDFAFRERRTHRVVARVFEGNEATANIWEKLGFRHEATFEESEFLDGDYVDVRLYAVLEDEWFDR